MSSENEVQDEFTPLSAIQLLDAAIWRMISSDEPQSQSELIEALSRLLASWMLTRSQAPELEVLATLCKTRAYICEPERLAAAELEQKYGVKH